MQRLLDRRSTIAALLVLGVVSSPTAAAAGGWKGAKVTNPSVANARQRGTAFKAVRDSAATRLKAVDGQMASATLKTSPNLSWTRQVLRSPRSDWGIEGVGRTFNEKRSALVNIEFARRHIRALRAEVGAFKAQHRPALLQRFGLWNMERKLKAKEAKLGNVRESLRATSDIWRAQWVVTAAASPEQVKVLEAVLKDTQNDRGTVDAYIAQHIRQKYGM